MPDREKVINALGRCESYGYCEDMDCPYYKNTNCLELLRKDALALLKEQKSVKAVADGDGSYMCNNCGAVIGWAECETGGIEEVKYKFCPECGRIVKWDD